MEEHAKPNSSTPNETDSFDEIKGDPVNMEAIFSTAAGVRIEVDVASLEKTKHFLNAENDKFFSSPMPKSKTQKNGKFVSPFRSTESNSSGSIHNGLKRSMPGSFTSPLVKNPGPVTKKRFVECSSSAGAQTSNSSEDNINNTAYTGILLASEEIRENSEICQVVMDDATLIKVLVHLPLKQDDEIPEIFHKVTFVDTEVITKDKHGKVVEISAKKALRYGKGEEKCEKHTLGMSPFIREPSFIKDLEGKTGTAVVHAYIADFGPKTYNGCSECKYHFNKKEKEPRRCPNCRSVLKDRHCIYSMIRLVDFSGQVKVHVGHDTMSCLLEQLGYKSSKQMDKFSNLQEQSSYIFKPIMAKINRNDISEVWSASEFSDMNWKNYSEWLDEKQCHNP